MEYADIARSFAVFAAQDDGNGLLRHPERSEGPHLRGKVTQVCVSWSR